VVKSTSEELRTTEDLAKEVNQLAELFHDLDQRVNDQGPQVEALSNHIEMTNIAVKAGTQEIIQARDYDLKSKRLLYGLGLATLAVGGPVTVGLKATLAVAVALGGYGLIRTRTEPA